MKNKLSFFLIDFPAAIKVLKPDTQPQWGEMKPREMLDHLRKGFELSISDQDFKISTPEKHLDKMKAFILSNKPMTAGASKPYSFDTLADLDLNFEDTKVELMRSMIKALSHFEKNPQFSSVHPYFGELNVEEWLALHTKHLSHHLRQFSLLQEV